MILLDTNILIYAHRQDSRYHEEYCEWLQSVINGPEPFGVSEIVLSSVIRISTNPQIFKNPSSPQEALTFVEQVKGSARGLVVNPGPKHWSIFSSLVLSLKLTGNDVPDAYLAALALEWGYELVTTDQGFSRFPMLRWRHPLSR